MVKLATMLLLDPADYIPLVDDPTLPDFIESAHGWLDRVDAQLAAGRAMRRVK